MLILKRVAIFTVGLLFLITAAANGAGEKDVKTKPGPKAAEVLEEAPKIVLRVNAVELDELDLEGMIKTLLPGASVHQRLTQEKQKAIRVKAVDRLIIRELFIQEARSQGIKIKPQEIDKQVAEIKKNYKGKGSLETFLKKNKLTMDGLRKELEKGLLLQRYETKVNDEIKKDAKKKITDAYIEEYYNKNKERFKEPERIRLREITIKADPGGGKEVWQEAFNTAKQLRDRIDKGEDFAKVAKESSQDPYAVKGGDMGFGHVGSHVPELENAAARLKVGEVSGPIWSIYGYHIIKLEEKAPPIQRTFEEVKDAIRGDRGEAEFIDMKYNFIQDLKKKAKIEYLIPEDKKEAEDAEKKAKEKGKK
ncbi:MAG: peptidyl-prolyl cis-trans isomerase [Deltaproteobacteria bacterium]|nr:peptidyl-prolyl cis-trans isomerase [Deltaproteobacteria bacterium]